MFERLSFVDERLLANEFSTGDFVRKTGLRDFVLSPYMGRVVCSNTETGKVQVQWPWGSEQESPVELVRICKDNTEYLPPELVDQTYSTWEQARHTDGPEVAKADAKWRKSLAARVAERYEAHTMPLYHAACEAWHCQMSEIETFMKMSSVFGEDYSDDAIRVTVSNLYNHGRKLAIYYHDNKRRYRVTQKEKDSKKILCPRCKGILKPRVFRQGKRLLTCNSCGFSISPVDLVASSGAK